MRKRDVRFLSVLAGGGALGLLAIAPSPASATTVDPPIFVQQSGTAPAGGDPNYISDTSAFTVGVTGGTFTLQNPLLVIVGVYDGNGTPTITFSGGVTTPTIGTYGLKATTGTFTSLSTGDAYAQLGLSAGGSQNFGNWLSADTAMGLAAPTSFTLYAFALNTSLTSGSPITIGETSAAEGSFIIAYDCEAGTATSNGCRKAGNIGQTPFTNAGLVDSPRPVPEPTSLALFGTALVGLGVMTRRRRRGRHNL